MYTSSAVLVETQKRRHPSKCVECLLERGFPIRESEGGGGIFAFDNTNIFSRVAHEVRSRDQWIVFGNVLVVKIEDPTCCRASVGGVRCSGHVIRFRDFAALLYLLEISIDLFFTLVEIATGSRGPAHDQRI